MSTPTPASAAPMKYGDPISLDVARQIAAAAEAEAIAQGWPMVIAIVDTGAHLKLLLRMDDTQIGSVQVAQRKAETAAAFKRSTKVFEELLAGGGAGLKMLSVADVCMLEGGLPIVKDGRIIGAIGVSGMASHQDAQVARAGLAAIA